VAAPKGNTYACGSSYDLDAEADALDAWSKRDDALALCGFCVERDIYAQRVYEWRDSSPKFAETLNKAKMRIAHRQRQKLHDKDNPYNYGLFMREIGFHDKFIHDHETSEKDADARRGKEIAENASEGFKQALASTVNMLSDERQSRARKSDESKSIKDK
jgi:hypothetical protein